MMYKTTTTTVGEFTDRELAKDANLDPLTDEAGAHPVGVGVGATAGGVSGALIGAAVGGPVGAGVGAVVGGIAGGLAGKGAAEAVNPTIEHEFWRTEYVNRPYITRGTPYDDYGPAYQYGWESYGLHSARAKSFDEIEPQLRRDWEKRRGTSKLSWQQAKDATRDSWDRLKNRLSNDD